jgi:hypothetical protein
MNFTMSPPVTLTHRVPGSTTIVRVAAKGDAGSPRYLAGTELLDGDAHATDSIAAKVVKSSNRDFIWERPHPCRDE